MHWNDWPIVCWILSTLLCLWARRWIDALASACFAVFMILDRLLPTTVPAQVKWTFCIVGAAVVVSQVAKEYAKYKKGLPAP